MYIALEGVDTSGKTTQIALLKDSYPEAIFTKEPGGSTLGAQIRQIILHQTNQTDTLAPKTEFLLFLADRAEHTAKVIAPHQDKLIISDRSIISGIAYGASIPQAKELNLFATDHIIPDVVILLQTDLSTLTSRLAQKSHDTIESRGISYLLEVQEALKATAKDLGCQLYIIPASQDKAAIHTQIKQIITTHQ
ncbi:dTMP kinase [Helicobacter sp. 12S02634-8]|uniref:dTMP kinase n=1 Tax=Helicobacter sp. 12S02634-8 TaxID=1476199 RepID=UPI000BA60E98|nr:dTMP kinase [Helicobacter sp. 12S02634-8]PAF48146.1 dTMP kinase [Helicobacter sp. 12S02634-8]